MFKIVSLIADIFSATLTIAAILSATLVTAVFRATLPIAAVFQVTPPVPPLPIAALSSAHSPMLCATLCIALLLCRS